MGSIRFIRQNLEFLIANDFEDGSAEGRKGKLAVGNNALVFQRIGTFFLSEGFGLVKNSMC